ncbi:MAG: hypothetical protein DRP06_03050 [Candidatus Aenigmatarchaeota archaeon]|nr:MAG: hypothetical protein DRP06_03050 [Candidatus Aenigmarchaeota archaeon]
MILQYGVGREEKNPRETNKNYFIAYFAVVLIIAGIFLASNPTKESYENNICEQGENCFDCPKDCKCNEGGYCSSTEKTCIKSTCGDGNCEPYENLYACCLDCKCFSPMEICNEETKSCETQEIKINTSDKTAIELTIGYFENLSIEINSTEISGVDIYQGKSVKQVEVQISGEDWFRYVAITEEGAITELPIF